MFTRKKQSKKLPCLKKLNSESKVKRRQDQVRRELFEMNLERFLEMSKRYLGQRN